MTEVMPANQDNSPASRDLDDDLSRRRSRPFVIVTPRRREFGVRAM
jgi:hypothetical protein